MVTGKEDLLSAFIETYAMEKGLREFYEFAASKAATDSARTMFVRLRDWESTHMDYLSFLHRSISGDLDLQTYEQFEKTLRPGHMESGQSLAEAESLFRPEECPTDRDAVALALRIEGKAYALYRRLSESAADSNARVVFRNMMEQEQKHIDLLKTNSF